MAEPKQVDPQEQSGPGAQAIADIIEGIRNDEYDFDFSSGPFVPPAEGLLSGTDEDPAEQKSISDARRLLLDAGDRLLVSWQYDGTARLMMLTDVGLWSEDKDMVYEAILEAQNKWVESASQVAGRNAALKAMGGSLNKIVTNLKDVLAHYKRSIQPAGVKNLLECVGVATLIIDDAKKRSLGLTECREEDIDADLRYLGTASGVVDLWTGQLLSPEVGKTKLVSKSTGVAYRQFQSPQSDYVESILGHLPAQEREWLLGCVGFALHGTPDTRGYLIRGPSRAGKSTLLRMIAAALGDYATRRDGKFFIQPKFGRPSGGADPELASLEKVRVLLASDIPAGRLDRERWNTLTGEDAITARDLYQSVRIWESTTTPFLACNEGHEPKFSGDDTAMMNRMQVLPYPARSDVEQVSGFATKAVKDRAAQETMLNELILAAQIYTSPPKDIPSIVAARSEVVKMMIGDDAYSWIKANVIKTDNPLHVLFTSDLWAAARSAAGERDDAKVVWGYTRQRLVRQVRQMQGLDMTANIRRGVKVGTAWRGARLRTSDDDVLVTCAMCMSEVPVIDVVGKRCADKAACSDRAMARMQNAIESEGDDERRRQRQRV